MNWILLVMGTIVAVVVAMLAGGALSPRERTATRTLRTTSDASALFALVRAADGPPRWCPDLPTMRAVQENAPHEVRFVLVNDDGTEMGSWVATIAASAEGSAVTIVETVTVQNLLLRFLRSFGGNGARPERFLTALAGELRVPVRIDSPAA